MLLCNRGFFVVRGIMTPKLTEFTLEITQQCPNKCLFCSSRSDPTKNIILRPQYILKIAREAKQLGLETIAISGGEPLLYPDIVDLLYEIKLIGLKIKLYTSGSCYNKGPNKVAIPYQNWAPMVPLVDQVIFNLQSDLYTEHDQLTGTPGSFHRCVTSMCSALDLRIPIEIHIIPNNINASSLRNLVLFATRLGVSQVSVLQLVPQGHASSNMSSLRISNLELGWVMDSLRPLNGPSTKVRLGRPLRCYANKPRSECPAGATKLVVRYDGAIFPCEGFKETRLGQVFLLGNVVHCTLMEALEKAATIPLDRKVCFVHQNPLQD